MRTLPIEVAFIELANLEKTLGYANLWDKVCYHSQTKLCWVTHKTQKETILYLDADKYGPIVETLNETGDLEEHMSVSL
jgi:hypothetical protein